MVDAAVASVAPAPDGVVTADEAAAIAAAAVVVVVAVGCGCCCWPLAATM